MALRDILVDNVFHMGVTAHDKQGIIQEIAAFFSKTYGMAEKEVFQALWSREQKGSTGLGKGLAVPHARVAGTGSMKIVILYSREGRQFDAYDQQPTHLFFAAVIDEEAQPHDQLEVLGLIVETCEKTDLISALSHAVTDTDLQNIVLQRIKEIQNS